MGLSTAAGAFTEEIVRELAGKTERPIIFPLSNPTSHAEAHPAELDAWTDGRALIATGSPFAPMQRDGVERPIAQCNNVYIFPAMGLAVTAAQATRVTDDMMRVAAATLGDASPALSDPDAPLLPAWSDVPDIALRIAACRRPPGHRGRRRARAQRRTAGGAHRTSALDTRVSGARALGYLRRVYRSTNRRRIVGGYSICRCRAAVFSESADSGAK